MKFRILVFVIFSGFGFTQAQVRNDSKQQYASLGDFNLENGQKIEDCKIGYRTFGKLNTDKSNAIIYLCGLTMNTGMLQTFVPGMLVDTTKYYLILIDALGNGFSSSPSNSAKQPRLQFPEFSIKDMVESQHKLLTEKMGISHLVAISGVSMGAIQTFQWAIDYPDFMEKALPYIGSPKPGAYDLLWSNTFLRAIKMDPAYKNGNYESQPVLEVAPHIMEMVQSSPEFVTNSIPSDKFYENYSKVEKAAVFDWNNMVRQLGAILKYDITKSANGSLEETAKKIKAKLLIINVKQDHTVNPINSQKFAAMLTNAKYVELDDAGGHTTYKMPMAVMHEFLNN